METGDQIRGRDAVRDHIVALHSELFEARPELRNLSVTDGAASVEAEFVGRRIRAELAGVPPTGAEVRLPYAVFYDVKDGSITALAPRTSRSPRSSRRCRRQPPGATAP